MTAHKPIPPSIVQVVGPKGGVGKSFITHCVIDWLVAYHNQEVLIIDGDSNNSDVQKVHANREPTPRGLDLDVREGWLGLVDACGEYPAAQIVINTGGRNERALNLYLTDTLNRLAVDGRRNVVVLWVIDNMRDCIEQLRTYLENSAARRFPLHVACSEGKSEGASFELFRSSRTAAMVAKAGGQVFTVPNIAERITKPLYNDRTPLHVLAGDSPAPPVPFGNRIEVERLRAGVWPALEELWRSPPEC